MDFGVGKTLFCFFVCLIMAWLSIGSVYDLVNKKDVYTARIVNIEPFYEVRHTFSVDYYYLGVEADTHETYIIKEKNTFEDNFNSGGSSRESRGYEITGIAREINDLSMESELKNNKYLLRKKYAIGNTYYLQVDYKQSAILRIITFVIWMMVIAIGFLVSRANIVSKGLMSAQAVLFMIGAAILCFA
ncbi:MAG: hypothetical protein IKN54_03370 [Lachnospiraceae bacterium]|nr:hypothetical protein [Lachnospiraceae bacterium]